MFVLYIVWCGVICLCSVLCRVICLCCIVSCSVICSCCTVSCSVILFVLCGVWSGESVCRLIRVILICVNKLKDRTHDATLRAILRAMWQE